MLPSTKVSGAPRHRLARSRSVLLTALTVVTAAAAATTVQLQSAPAQAATAAYSLWTTDVVPRNPADSDAAKVTVGVSFSSSVAGTVNGVEFYKSAKNTGPHVGQLWGPAGKLLAKVTFPTGTATGWQVAKFSSPVRIAASTKYVASYTAPKGHYAGDANALSPAKPKVTKALTAWQGVYSYGTTAPAKTWQDTNYYVDVLFAADDAPAPTTPAPPAPTTTAPAPTTPAPTTTAPAPTTPAPTTTKPAPTTTAPAPTTTAPAPTTSAPAPTGGKPGPTTTGVPAGTALSAVSGGMRITQANTVVNAKDITGAVVVEASNVTIRNSKIHGSGTDSYGVYVRSGSVKIEDSEIWGFQNGIAFDNWTATRVNLHGMTDDGVKLGDNVTLQDSWIHDMTPSAGAHADGGQIQGGVRNVVVQHNVINMASGQELGNAALFIAPDLGPSSPGPVTISGNWLNGGNYTLFCVDGNNGQYFIGNIAIRDNRFGSDRSYGPARVNVPVTASGNVMDATGAPVNF